MTAASARPAVWVRLCATAALAALAAAPSAGAAETVSALPTFSAHYTADWHTINVGTSDLDLRPDPAVPGHYVYTWTVTARGVFRIVYHDDVVQTSWFSVDGGHTHPLRYRGVQGSASVNLDFDWNAGRVRGSSENKPVDFELKHGMQDLMSIQVEVLLGLENGDLAKTFWIIDKDQPKEFNYTNEGHATIRTAIGSLDTIVVASQRTNNNRILRMWFAPSLGYIPVQAERSRDGKLEFAMRIKTLKH